MGDAKDLYETVGGSVNDTLDKIKDLYGGTGTLTGSADIDLTPKGTEDSKTGNTTPPAPASSNETTNSTKDDPEDVNLIIKQNMVKAAEFFAKYRDELMDPQRVFKVNDSQMLEMMNRQFSVMAGVSHNTPDYVWKKDVQPVVINNHYDSMINVEGSVDKSFSKEFKKDSEEIYNGVVNKLVKGLKNNGVNFVRRPTLPTIS